MELTEKFDIAAGVKQGCILGMDGIIKKSTENTRRGIRLTLTSTLENLNFADIFLGPVPQNPISVNQG